MHFKVISKYLATHPNYYEIFSKLSKLGNIMTVEILTLNFSIKDGLKIISNIKMENCLSVIDQGLHYTVNLESIKTVYKKTI